MAVTALAGPEDDFAAAKAKRGTPFKTILSAISAAGVDPSGMEVDNAYRVSSIYGDPQGVVYYASNAFQACEIYVPLVGKAKARCLAR